MHLVGARFTSLAAATAALREIRAGTAVAPGDVAVRPLGSTRYEEPAEDFLLAGRFGDAEVDAVIEITERHGGRILALRRESSQPSFQRHAQRHDRRGRRPAAAAGHRSPYKRRRRPAALVRGRAARERRISG